MQTRRTNDPGGSTILYTPVHSIARWLSAWLIIALVAACGGGGGGGGSEPGNTGTPPPPGFRLLPARLALTIGADGMLLALQTAGALTWSSSDPAVASVDAQGQVMALAAGSAVISATSGAAVSSATVRVYPTTAPTPTALIATALAQNRITAER
jgi:Bacterial Ig-like domain (group 2)